MSDPYRPPLISPKQRTNPQRRSQFAFLNAVLLGIPLAVALFSIASTMIEMQVEAAKKNGDPVTYQSHCWNFAPHAVWLILAYFSAPNLGLLGLHAILKWQK